MRISAFAKYELGLLLLACLSLVVLATLSDRFFTIDNLLNQARLMAEIGLVSLAMTLVIVSGGIDLSVGSILGLSAMLLGILWRDAGLPLPVSIACALAAGTLAGLTNGIIITRFSVPPLIATLATLALYRGLAEGISQARSVRGFPEWFMMLGQGQLAGVPSQVWILGLVSVLTSVALGLTKAGRAIYAIGSNEVAARFSGVAVDRVKVAIYGLSGFTAALAAVIFVSRVTTTRSDMGTGIELDAITAVVLGGTSIFGGRGTVIGTILGLVLIQALKSGLSLAGVRGDGTVVAIGAVLIATVFLSNLFLRHGEG
ncbi:ABC transporter permease [Mesorhizobium sp. LNJC405B00]|uniref:ABC transporter permease n=1 Tax=Mesorhizobium sp. LNJC405B00 TaxID=1287281 RepID=UPI0003CE2FDA|nr:ABC transporter permease [Mesorhizobium sp. LNJC405B00]ESY01353.1 ABC transporter permease [Mesorhizobium sp. LNJC405B00]